MAYGNSKNSDRVNLTSQGLRSSDYDDFMSYVKKTFGDNVNMDAIGASFIRQYYDDKKNPKAKNTNSWSSFAAQQAQNYGL